MGLAGIGLRSAARVAARRQPGQRQHRPYQPLVVRLVPRQGALAVLVLGSQRVLSALREHRPPLSRGQRSGSVFDSAIYRASISPARLHPTPISRSCDEDVCRRAAVVVVIGMWWVVAGRKRCCGGGGDFGGGELCRVWCMRALLLCSRWGAAQRVAFLCG